MLRLSPVATTWNVSPLLDVNTRLLPAVLVEREIPAADNAPDAAILACRPVPPTRISVVGPTAPTVRIRVSEAPVAMVAVAPLSVPITLAAAATTPAPCARTLRSAPVEADAAVAVPEKPKVVESVPAEEV